MLFQFRIQDPLNLSVDRTKFICSPFFKGFINGRIKPEHKHFFARHTLLMQGPGIHNRGRVLVGTEDYHQVADHGGLFILVKFHHMLLA